MIADRIKELRERSGYTQATLAKRLGLTRASINAWESGVSAPSTQYLIELAKLFKVTTDYILDLSASDTLNISSLKVDQKNMIFNMVNYLENYNDIMSALGVSSLNLNDAGDKESLIAALKKYNTENFK